MGVVRGTVLYGPVLHDGSHCIGNSRIQGLAIAYGLDQGTVDSLGQALAHHLVIKYIAAKQFCRLDVFVTEAC